MESISLSDISECNFEISDKLHLVVSPSFDDQHLSFYLMNDETYVVFTDTESFKKEHEDCYSVSDDGEVLCINQEEYELIVDAVKSLKRGE